MSEGRAGVINFVGAVFKDMSTRSMTYRVSDHLPLWVEFMTDRSVEALALTLGVDPDMPNPFAGVPDSAVAQMAEQEVEQRVLSFYQTINDGDAEAWASHNAAQYHGNFPRTGLLLNEAPATAEGIGALFDAGLSYQLVVRHLDITVYGNTAVATFYTTGPTNSPNGNVLDGTFRVTQVWVREGQSWNVANFHISPLESTALGS